MQGLLIVGALGFLFIGGWAGFFTAITLAVVVPVLILVTISLFFS